MMWFSTVGAMLAKASGPVAGALRNPAVLIGVAVLAAFLSLSLVLWWTAGRLSDARERLANVRADMAQCVQANVRSTATVEALRETMAANAAERERALADQAAAIERIEELEREQEQDASENVERIIIAAGDDFCAGAVVPGDVVRLLVDATAGGD